VHAERPAPSADRSFIDKSTLRHAEFTGPGLESYSLHATDSAITVDGGRCNVTADSVAIR
jgi:hypothetical protein